MNYLDKSKTLCQKLTLLCILSPPKTIARYL